MPKLWAFHKKLFKAVNKNQAIARNRGQGKG